MADCIKRIFEQSDGYFSEKEAKGLLDNIQKEAEGRALREGKSPEDFYKDIYLEKAKAQYIKGQVTKRSELINESVRAMQKNKIDTLVGQGLSRYQAVRASIAGHFRRGTEAKYGADAQYKATQSKYIRELLLPIEKRGWIGYFANKRNEQAIYKELSRISNPGIKATGIPQAVLIAKQVQKTLRAMVIEKNRSGANIGILSDHEIVHSHDAAKISSAGFDKWASDIKDLIDVDRTMKAFAGTGKTFSNIMRDIYADITDHKKLDATGSDIGDKMAAHRALHFKNDGESWLKYNSAYGYGSLAASVANTIERGSRDLIMLRNFGTNPDKMFESMTSGMTRAEQKELSILYKNVDGSLNNPINPTIAKIGYGIRAWNSVRMLGKMVPASALMDSATKALDAQWRGVPFAKSYIKSLSDILNPFSFSEKRRLASMVGVGHSGMVGHFLSKTYSPDGIPGAMANLQRLFFKFNTQNIYDDASKQGVAAMMMHDLAFDKGIAYEKLNPKTRSALDQYGISADHWDVIRKYSHEMDGKEYIAPDTIDEADSSAFTEFAKKQYGTLLPSPTQLERARDDVANRLRTYIVDRVQKATSQPDANTHAITNRGIERGTYQGEALALFMQFKSFSIAMGQTVYGRVFQDGSKSPDVPMLIQSIIGLTLAGYTTNALLDLAAGREPKPITDASTFEEAFVRGGGGGILADSTINTQSGTQKWIQRFSGPTYGNAINDFMDIKSAAFDGEDISKRSFKYLGNMVPGNNLYYKPVFDYLFLNQLRETIAPGTAARLQDYARQHGQGFWLPPTKTLQGDVK